MDASQLALITALVFGFGLVSRLLERTVITMPIVFVFAGIASEATGLIDLGIERESIALLAEITLALILFSDASRIDARTLRFELGLPVRLLSIGLPLSILLGAVVVALLVPALGVWEAALVAAILAPTDAALGQAVVEEPSVPERVRQGLNVESGLNDGIALPAVFLFAALSAGEQAETGFWLRFVFEQVGYGALVGIACGWLGARALDVAMRSGWIDGIYAQLATLALAVGIFATATEVGGNAFIAVFVAGLVFGVASDRSHHTVEYTEDTSRLFSALTFFVFGNVIVPTSAVGLSAAVAACVVASLTIGRLIPVFVATLTKRPNWRTVLFLGWFGPRGLASIVFALILLEDEQLGETATTEQIISIVSWTVLASVVLHGVTSGHGARAYGRWYASAADDHPDMVEAGPTPIHRTRFGSPSSGAVE